MKSCNVKWVLVCACFGLFGGLPTDAQIAGMSEAPASRERSPRGERLSRRDKAVRRTARKPAWPSPQSICVKDEQCEEGLVCEVVEASTVAPVDVPPGAPRVGDKACQAGCHIADTFVEPDARDDYPNNCWSCQPAVSTSSWTAASQNLECRAAAGNCDLAEFCDGDSGACPDDAKQGDSHVCRDAADVCDTAEFCDGLSDDCPDDLKQAATFMCRGVGGSCDKAEYCDGSNDACPADTMLGASVECRSSTSPCDAPEFCSGDSYDCPADMQRSANHVCRPAGGPCDLAELCDGATDICPPDVKRDVSHECRPVAGACDVADFCNGNDNACPADVVLDNTHECRAAAGVCDLAESCDGAAAACPRDSKLDQTSECRAAAGPCDLAETCDGENDVCPGDVKQEALVECRAADNTCDTAETCDGMSDDCPPPSRTLCPDGAVCTADEACESGSCFDTTCAAPVDNGVACDSDPDCLGQSLCDRGVCRSTLDGTCDDAILCASGLACDSVSSTCKLTALSACERSEDCVDGLTCDAGSNTCLGLLGGDCVRSNECASGLICACDSFSTSIGGSAGDRCLDAGECRVPVGGACERDAHCGVQRAIDLGEEFWCPAGVCEQKLVLGAVCQVDPPAEVCDPGCVLSPSPNDEACASGTCFLPVGNAPPYDDPPDFVCCSDLGGACVDDEDCCLEPRRRQRICSNGACVRVAIAGEPCETTSDCDQFAQGAPTGLECNANKICEVPPPEPGTLPDGSTCTVAGDCMSLHCAETRDEGFKCLPKNEDGSKSAGFGEVCDGNGFNYAGDPSLRSCTDDGGDMVCCSGTGLAAVGETGRCRGCCRNYDTAEDEIGCGLDPASPNYEPIMRCADHNGPTTRACGNAPGVVLGPDNERCPDGQECVQTFSPRCCGGRCANILDDADNCGGCGNDCSALAGDNPCMEFQGCGSGISPGVCEFDIPCEAPEGFYPGCYDSREDTCGVLIGDDGVPDTCSGIWPLDPEYGDCVDDLGECWDNTPAEATCYIVERLSDTLCKNCDSDADCDLEEICYSHCGGGKHGNLFSCAYGGYCANKPGDCDDPDEPVFD